MARTATEKQIHYARDISRALDIPVPAEESVTSYGHFIATNCEEYYAVKKRKAPAAKKEKFVVQEVEARIRLQNIKQRMSEKPLDHPEAVIAFMKQQMKALSSETVYVMNLDAKCRPINFCKVSVGTVSESLTSGREIFKTAILSNAASILLFHNHVSGDVTPSRQDELLTETMIKCGELLGIPLTDHIIVSAEDYYSFLESHSIYKNIYTKTAG